MGLTPYDVTGCERVENCGLISQRNENKSNMDKEVTSRKEGFLVLFEAAESNHNPGFSHSSSMAGKRFDKACCEEERAFSSATAPKKGGGFTCCVPLCFNNNNNNNTLFSHATSRSDKNSLLTCA